MSKALLAAALAALTMTGAGAQQASDAIGDILAKTTTPAATPPPNLSQGEAAAVSSALAAARQGDKARFDSAVAMISDMDARRLATWAFVDVNGEKMSFFELDSARRDLAGWPREARRQTLTESRIEIAGLEPQQVIDWFAGAKPTTGQGALALVTAYQALGREDEARTLAVNYWRTLVMEASEQSRFLARFGGMLSPQDHAARADMLLYGPQGPAAKAMLDLLSPGDMAAAQARIALRSGNGNADSIIARIPTELQNSGGVIFERVARARRSGDEATALALAPLLPPAPGYEDADQRLYNERRNLFVDAMQARNYQAAYATMNNNGFATGVRRAEADFFAGWVALTKLNDPAAALEHFKGIQVAGTSSLTQGRALYWLGRAEEALGDQAAAQDYYRQGSQYLGAFYGQLSAEKAGITTLTLPPEPQPTAADIARFESRPQIRAMRILLQADEKTLFKSFAGAVDDNLPTAEEYALLMDMLYQQGEQFAAMMAGRGAAGRGFILPERMYPLRAVPSVPGAPDPAFVMAITRQESSFDPKIRSSADARGMMMLLPSTAQGVARRMGLPYRDLYDADYNMQLGTYHLGELMNAQSGSFILTAVGYNAGPARPPQWMPYCGDPRGFSTDPLDFIECVPFTETRDYMMRVMENVQIYRARLNGGSAPLTPSLDLKRGGYNAVAAN